MRARARAAAGPRSAGRRARAPARRLARLIEQSGVQHDAERDGRDQPARRRWSSALLRGAVRAASACGGRRRRSSAWRCRSLWLAHRRSVAAQEFEEQFPEALDLLSRAIRAGHAFQTAMGMVADELPAPVGPEFKKTFDRQNFGLPLRDAMNELAERVADPGRAVLRHRRGHPARDRRQPGRDSRQPRARRPRALQDPPAGARAHRARPLHRLRAAGAAGGAGGRAVVHQPGAHEAAVRRSAWGR